MISLKKIPRSVRAVSSLGFIGLIGLGVGQPLLAADDAQPARSTQRSFDRSIDEVVVTARRRDESAQDVPIALSVVNENALEATGSFSLGEIQRLVPSLQISNLNPRNTNINIRGLGSSVALTNDGFENGVGVYIDNVYYGRVGQSQFDLVDLSQVEVLRGPQGTLFGKNTTAGAISISTKAPSFEPEYSAEISSGENGYLQARTSFSGPLVEDKVAYRLSLAHTERDGFVKNVHNGKDVNDYRNVTARAQLLIVPTNEVEIRLIGDYSRQDANSVAAPLVGSFETYDDGTPIPNNFQDRIDRAGYTPVSLNPFDHRVDLDSHFQADMSSYGGSAQVDWDLGDNTLTSISAYRWWDWNPANDGDRTGLNVFPQAYQENRQRQFSQEIRLASNSNEFVDYVAGVYHLWQRNEGNGASELGSDAPDWFLPALPAAVSNAALNGFRAESYSVPETQSSALFGQLTWHLSDKVELSTGLRYTYEKKDGTYRQRQVGGTDLGTLPPDLAAAVAGIRQGLFPVTTFETSFSDSSVAGLASLSYALTPDVLVYGTYSCGGKSGGLNLTAIPGGVDPHVYPEKISNYEIGLKSQWFDGRLTVSSALYLTEIRDYQTAITEQLANTVAFRQYISNTGKVRSQGFETDVIYQFADLGQVYAAVTFADVTYRDYANAQQAPENLNLGSIQDLTGERLPGVPEVSYVAGFDYALPVNIGQKDIEFYTSASYSHNSSYFTDVSNSRYSKQDDYGLLTARIGARTVDGRWDLSLWGKNLTDEEYFQVLSPQAFGLVTGVVGEPRVIGATLKTHF